MYTNVYVMCTFKYIYIVDTCRYNRIFRISDLAEPQNDGHDDVKRGLPGIVKCEFNEVCRKMPARSICR